MTNPRIQRTLALVTLLACAAPARAQTGPVEPAPAAPSDPDAQAARWMGTGNRAFKEGHFAEAEEAYRQAFTLKRGYDIAGNLGAAELAQGKLRDAAQHLAFTLRLFPLTGEPALREQMARAYEQCRRGVAALRVQVEVKGATIFVDGAAVGEAPLPDEVFVEPGEHVVEARLGGYTGAPLRLVAVKGTSADVTLELTPVPRPPPAPPPTPPVRHRSPAPGLGLAAVAVVGFGSGAALLGLSSSKRAEAVALGAVIVGPAPHHACVSGAANYDAASCPTLASTLRADDTYHDVAVGALLAGSAAAVGAATWLLWPQRRPVSGLRVTPILGGGQGGATVSGSF